MQFATRSGGTLHVIEWETGMLRHGMRDTCCERSDASVRQPGDRNGSRITDG